MKISNFTEADKPQVEAIFDLYWNDDFRKSLQNKVDAYLAKEQEILDQGFEMFVCKKGDEVLGVAAYRKAPKHMQEYTSTENPAEFYVSAVKKKGEGVGSKLRDFRIKEAKQNGFTELVFFSGETHTDSWGFHDSADFKRVGEMSAPDGEKGYVWVMSLV